MSEATERFREIAMRGRVVPGAPREGGPAIAGFVTRPLQSWRAAAEAVRAEVVVGERKM
jgi:hypothetical protein